MAKDIVKFYEFTTIITFRQPVYTDNTIGQPEITGKFTTEPRTTANKKQISKKATKLESYDASSESEGIIEL